MSFYVGKTPEGGVNDGLVGTDDTLVSRMRWNRLAEGNTIIGTCRTCGGDLEIIPAGAHDPEGEDGQVTWYDIRCRACGAETAAPNGRILRKSSLHGEMPRGWWDGREKRDADEAKQRAGGGPA